MTPPSKDIIIPMIEDSIQAIKKYIDESSTTEPLIASLEALKEDPNSELLLEQLTSTFNDLGIIQGAVLTYAPYIASVISDDLFRGE